VRRFGSRKSLQLKGRVMLKASKYRLVLVGLLIEVHSGNSWMRTRADTSAMYTIITSLPLPRRGCPERVRHLRFPRNERMHHIVVGIVSIGGISFALGSYIVGLNIPLVKKLVNMQPPSIKQLQPIMQQQTLTQTNDHWQWKLSLK
jgi:hypothetical protein